MTVLTVGLLVQRVQGPWLEPLMVRSRFLAKRLKTNLPDTAFVYFLVTQSYLSPSLTSCLADKGETFPKDVRPLSDVMLGDYPSGPSVLAVTEKAAKESSSLGKSLNRVNSPLI